MLHAFEVGACKERGFRGREDDPFDTLLIGVQLIRQCQHVRMPFGFHGVDG